MSSLITIVAAPDKTSDALDSQVVVLAAALGVALAIGLVLEVVLSVTSYKFHCLLGLQALGEI